MDNMPVENDPGGVGTGGSGLGLVSDPLTVNVPGTGIGCEHAYGYSSINVAPFGHVYSIMCMHLHAVKSGSESLCTLHIFLVEVSEEWQDGWLH